MAGHHLILASASPRRRDILNTLGLPHRILTVPDPTGMDEPRLPGEPPAAYVRRTAMEKGRRVMQYINCDSPHILSADTCVILDEHILGKPVDKDHAIHMLRTLSDRTHTVHTAVAIWHKGQHYAAESITQVTFGALSDKDIQHYYETGECWGKAGAYGIQGYAARFVSHLSGSYTGVVGLPAWETVQLLRQSGYLS